MYRFLLVGGLALATTTGLFGQSNSVFVPLTPCRVVDTRGATGPLGGPIMDAGSTRSFAIPTGDCSIPATATGYSFNVTVVPKGALNYLTIWPTGETQPTVSTLNSPAGAVVANAALVPAGTSGEVSVYVTNTTNVIIDIDGYFAAESTSSGSSTAFGSGALVSNTGSFNTAIGFDALNANSSGVQNSALGTSALLHNTIGSQNSALGDGALLENTTGSQNTAMGDGALRSNTSGNYNTAVGYDALGLTQTVSGNTALGFQAGYLQSGSQNTAVGYSTLGGKGAGAQNTAVGYGALQSITNDTLSVAVGYNALNQQNLGTEADNTAVGPQAMQNLTTGNDNTALGSGALSNITTGYQNIAIGWLAGSNLTTENRNIDIGTSGQAGDSFVMRLGDYGQIENTYLAGIHAILPSGMPLYFDFSTGLLGIQNSSIRSKENVHDIGEDDGLMRLRPVSFQYKGTSPVQFGLIAEEVESVYPNLVLHDKRGQPMSVQYQELPALLLNQIQKQHKAIAAQQDQIERQQVSLTDAQKTIQDQSNDIRDLKERLASLEKLLQR